MGYRIVKMSTELFNMVMTEGVRFPDKSGKRLRVVKGLPEGAKLEAVTMEVYFVYDQIALKYSHSSWPDLPPGTAIPELQIEHAMEDDLPDVASDLTPMEELALRRG